MDGLSSTQQQSHAFFELVPGSVPFVRASPVVTVPPSRHVWHEPEFALAESVRPFSGAHFPGSATDHAMAHTGGEPEQCRARAHDRAVPAKVDELRSQSASNAGTRI